MSRRSQPPLSDSDNDEEPQFVVNGRPVPPHIGMQMVNQLRAMGGRIEQLPGGALRMAAPGNFGAMMRNFAPGGGGGMGRGGPAGGGPAGGDGQQDLMRALDESMRHRQPHMPLGLESDMIQQLPTTHTQLNDTCAICLSDHVEVGEEIRELGCKHIFHKKCLDRQLKERMDCPNCRRPVISSEAQLQTIIERSTATPSRKAEVQAAWKQLSNNTKPKARQPSTAPSASPATEEKKNEQKDRTSPTPPDILSAEEFPSLQRHQMMLRRTTARSTPALQAMDSSVPPSEARGPQGQGIVPLMAAASGASSGATNSSVSAIDMRRAEMMRAAAAAASADPSFRPNQRARAPPRRSSPPAAFLRPARRGNRGDGEEIENTNEEEDSDSDDDDLPVLEDDEGVPAAARGGGGRRHSPTQVLRRAVFEDALGGGRGAVSMFGSGDEHMFVEDDRKQAEERKARALAERQKNVVCSKPLEMAPLAVQNLDVFAYYDIAAQTNKPDVGMTTVAAKELVQTATSDSLTEKKEAM